MKLKQAAQIPESIICKIVWSPNQGECGGKAHLWLWGTRPIDASGLEVCTYICEKCRFETKACWAEQ